MAAGKHATVLVATALAAAALLAWPSAGQEQTPVVESAPPLNTPPPSGAGPKSLLPDAFGTVPAAPLTVPAPFMLPEAEPPAEESEPADASETAEAPAPTGRSVDVAGPLTPAIGGYGAATFAGSDGRFVAGLVRRLDAPLASRWAHIVLRRALLSESTAPSGINPADWIAERARLLLAMGEIDGAKALIDDLPADRFTPRLYRVAGAVNLAAADLPGLCPLAATGAAISTDPVWPLAEAMCAGLAGDDISAASAFDALRGGNRVDPFDVMLGERIATISGGGGRAANVEWESVARLTPYRFGVATAAGVAVPQPLLARLAAATGGTSWGWVLRAPNQPPEARAAALRPAAVIGIASANEIVEAISAASADLDREALDASPAGTLRGAYAAATTADRVAAMRQIWDRDAADRYPAYLETALAAARIRPGASLVSDAPDLIAAMLSAGLDRSAARWWPVVQDRSDDAGARSWALLAAGAPGGITVSPDRFRAWAKTVGRHRAQLVLAAFDGLGYTSGSGWDALRGEFGLAAADNSWTRAIDAAAAAGRTGEVAVLAATGLQAAWSAVPPAHFARIVAAYVAIGRGHEARMLAAEAVTRG